MVGQELCRRVPRLGLPSRNRVRRRFSPMALFLLFSIQGQILRPRKFHPALLQGQGCIQRQAILQRRVTIPDWRSTEPPGGPPWTGDASFLPVRGEGEGGGSRSTVPTIRSALRVEHSIRDRSSLQFLAFRVIERARARVKLPPDGIVWWCGAEDVVRQRLPFWRRNSSAARTASSAVGSSAAASAEPGV